MPKVTLEDIIKARKALEKQIKELESEKDDMQTRIDKSMMEFKTTKGSLEEGLKVIDDLKKDLRKTYDNWQDLFTKTLPRVKDKISAVAKDVKAARPILNKVDSEADDLVKDLLRCGGDVAAMKAEGDALKAIQKTAKRLVADFNDVEDQANGIPADPKQPALQLA